MKTFILILFLVPLTVYAQKTKLKSTYKPSLPSQSERLVNYGFTELDNGNYKRALQLATQAIELNPNHYLAYYLRVQANMSIGDYDRNGAVNDLNTCLKLNTRFSPAYSYRSLFEEHEDKTKAYNDLTFAISYAEDADQKSSYYNSRAMLLIDMLDWVGALKDVNIALKLDPQSASALMIRGQIYTEQEKYNLAINDLDKAVNIMPTGDAFVFYYRGMAKAKAGKTESACADFERAKSILGSRQFNEATDKYCK